MGLISALIGIGQQAAQNRFTAEQNALDREFNSQESAKQRLFSHGEAQLAFDREMQADSTKYQRSVADMQAAGINPMLAATGGLATGSVHSSPASGSAASSSGNSPAVVGNLGQLFLQEKQLKMQQELTTAQVNKTNAETEKTIAETEETSLSNEFFKTTKDIRAVLLGDEHERNQWEKEIGLRGVDVKERYQVMLEKNAEHYNSMIDAQADLISEQKVSEEFKRALYRANAREANANASYKSAMIEVDKKYKEAATEESKQEAALLAIEARFKNGVYTPEYIRAICKEAKAEAELKTILSEYQKGDYHSASKELQKVFHNLEKEGKGNFFSGYNRDEPEYAKALPF